MKVKPIENDDRKQVNIYTYSLSEDVTHGLSVWVSLLSCASSERFLSGVAHHTNKNRAELYSIYAALKALKTPCNVHIYSDSQFISSAINLAWIEHWKEKGWNIHHKPVPNQDVWKALLPLLEQHTVTIEWVKRTDVAPNMQKCKEKAGELFLFNKG